VKPTYNLGLRPKLSITLAAVAGFGNGAQVPLEGSLSTAASLWRT